LLRAVGGASKRLALRKTPLGPHSHRVLGVRPALLCFHTMHAMAATHTMGLEVLLSHPS